MARRVLDERLYRVLNADKATLQEQIFTSPPKTMEDFIRRQAKWQQIDATMKLMVEHATKDEDERKDQK